MTPATVDDRLRRVEQKVGRFEERLDDIDAWVSDSRRFHTAVNSFMDTFNATQARIETEQDNRHKSNSNKLNALIALFTLLVFIATLACAYVAYQASHHQGLLGPLHSSNNLPVVAEESRIPELTR